MANKSDEVSERAETDEPTVEVDMGSISSVALARIIEEVRNDEPPVSRAYDRVHNRHNR